MMIATAEFELRVAPHRRELLTHCYRLLGSAHDAEDQVQETLVRAWRAFDRYDPTRASLRTWLYRIATNTCLTALAGRARRPLPSGLGPAFGDPLSPMLRADDVPWLQPLPDALGRADGGDPAEQAVQRSTLRLAFVAALQLLPARQRAMLVLHEVLDWSAAEVAEALGTTPTAVHSGLQRARARLAAAGIDDDTAALDPDDPACRALVDQYVLAFEAADVDALARLLTDAVVLEMPPVRNWYVGRADYAAFIAWAFARRGTGWRTWPIAANGQPGLVAYSPTDDGAYELHSVQLLTVTATGISANVTFVDPEALAPFDLPATISGSAPRDRRSAPR